MARRSVRRRRTAAEWRRIVERFEAGRLGPEAFCRREGISKASLARWRKRLEMPDRHDGAFVELALPPELERTRQGGGELVRKRPICTVLPAPSPVR